MMQGTGIARAGDPPEPLDIMGSISTRSRFGAHTTAVFAKFTLILCLILIFTTLSSCHANRAEIAVIPAESNEAEHEGAAAAARGLGLRIRWSESSRENDVESQIALVDRAVSERYRGLILAPDEPRALMVPIQRALAAGMRVVVVGAPLPLPPQRNLSYIVNDDEEIGRIAAMRIGEVLHGRGEVAVVDIDPYSLDALAILSSFVSATEQRFPKISVVDRRAATSSDLDSELVVNQVLLSHPHIGALFALDSRGTVGAYYALKIRSLTSRVKIVGVQQTEELANAIRSHQMDSIIAEDGYQMGYRAVEAVAHGEAKNPGVLKLAPMLITADNVDSTAAKSFLIFVRPAGWSSDYQ
jgi:ribose transport system substrate-binding protein